MALTGRPITAQEAWVGGLVSEVCPDDQVMETALKNRPHHRPYAAACG